MLLLGDGMTASTIVTPSQLLPQTAAPLAALLSNACLDTPLMTLRVRRARYVCSFSLMGRHLTRMHARMRRVQVRRGLGFNEARSVNDGQRAGGDKGNVVPVCLRRQFNNVVSCLNTVSGAVAEAWPANGAQYAAGTLEARSLREALLESRRRCGAVLAAPEAFKALLLAYSDLQQHQDVVVGGAGAAAAVAVAAACEQNRRSVEIIGEIVSLFRCDEPGAPDMGVLRARSVAVIDECDTVLHPLRSELNYPLGKPQPLPLGRLRYQLASFLCEAFVAAAAGARVAIRMSERPEDASSGAATPSTATTPGQIGSPGTSSAAAAGASIRLQAALVQGVREQMLMLEPHCELLSPNFYAANIAHCVAEVVLEWMREHCSESVGAALAEAAAAAPLEPPVPAPSASVDAIVIHFLATPLSAELVALEAPGFSARVFRATFTGRGAFPFLLLAQSLITAVLPLALTRQSRVHYGLLSEFDGETPSRRLLAVPFLGKDAPSPSAEFSHPDVRLLMTCFAYACEGLRRADVHEIMLLQSSALSRELGPPSQRSSAVRWGSWLAAARCLGGDTAAAAASLPKLEVLGVPDDDLITRAHVAFTALPVVRAWWLESILGRTNDAHCVQLTASGHDLGSDAIFSQRLAFSGTPTDLVPLALKPVYNQVRGPRAVDVYTRMMNGTGCQVRDEARILQVLTSPSAVEGLLELNGARVRTAAAARGRSRCCRVICAADTVMCGARWLLGAD